jgi:hypothetical protein
MSVHARISDFARYFNFGRTQDATDDATHSSGFHGWGRDTHDYTHHSRDHTHHSRGDHDGVTPGDNDDDGTTIPPTDTGNTGNDGGADPGNSGGGTDTGDNGGTDPGTGTGNGGGGVVVTPPTDSGDGGTTTPTSLVRHDATIDTDHAGQVIENVDVWVDEGQGVILDEPDTVLRNARIHYNGDGSDPDAAGVLVTADGVTIENVEVINEGAPDSGPESSADHYNIVASGASDLHVTNATLREGSTGIYVLDSPGAILQGIEGYDFHGPEPRGQLVQFDKSPDSVLQDFYVHNDPNVAFTEDNVSVYQSDNVTIQRGVIDGNNSPSGQGVIFEDSSNGLVSHVDTIHMGNGAFADFGSDNTFDFTRSFDNIATDQGRGEPMSGGLIWALSDDTTVTNSAYENPGDPDNIVWGGGYQDDNHNAPVDVVEITGQQPMEHWANDFNWS